MEQDSGFEKNDDMKIMEAKIYRAILSLECLLKKPRNATKNRVWEYLFNILNLYMNGLRAGGMDSGKSKYEKVMNEIIYVTELEAIMEVFEDYMNEAGLGEESGLLDREQVEKEKEEVMKKIRIMKGQSFVLRKENILKYGLQESIDKIRERWKEMAVVNLKLKNLTIIEEETVKNDKIKGEIYIEKTKINENLCMGVKINKLILQMRTDLGEEESFEKFEKGAGNNKEREQRKQIAGQKIKEMKNCCEAIEEFLNDSNSANNYNNRKIIFGDYLYMLIKLGGYNFMMTDDYLKEKFKNEYGIDLEDKRYIGLEKLIKQRLIDQICRDSGNNKKNNGNAQIIAGMFDVIRKIRNKKLMENLIEKEILGYEARYEIIKKEDKIKKMIEKNNEAYDRAVKNNEIKINNRKLKALLNFYETEKKRFIEEMLEKQYVREDMKKQSRYKESLKKKTEKKLDDKKYKSYNITEKLKKMVEKLIERNPKKECTQFAPKKLESDCSGYPVIAKPVCTF